MLVQHENYDTMSSWNNSKSYSRNVKVNRLNIPRNLIDVAYEICQTDYVHDDLRFIIEEFEERMNGNYTIGFNGRSGGYVVLYERCRESIQKPYITRCDKCYKPTWYEDGHKCMVCKDGTLRKYDAPKFKLVTRTTGLVKDEDDLKAMDDEELLDWVDLIMEFNYTVNCMESQFIYCCQQHLENSKELEAVNG